MSKVGLWIDHRKAIIVSIMAKREEVKKVVLESDKQSQYSSSLLFKNNHKLMQMPSNKFTQRTMQEKLNIYYDEIISNIYNANSILIFGPSMAKYELKYRLEMNKLSDRIVGIETVDNMTERQISAKIWQQVELKICDRI
ncbi:hypothetical protein [Pseudanabaena mucicola]|uniref:eRF1 domain-containing protein n=1 Tax=Pseudanabaena mucicola FACHB-723 TaxID=2692860 RepID=A0ABR7ZZF4_9CYAN|nr:hypothetical protein [Pseudanabaena mucicola]MBD2188472.1 hypothetical protein [Pseudanabaena mucicola FACHB-723]